MTHQPKLHVRALALAMEIAAYRRWKRNGPGGGSGLIVTAKLNDIDPQALLADVLARIAEPPTSRLDDLPPWNWRPVADKLAA
jgi:hypothetical protein